MWCINNNSKNFDHENNKSQLYVIPHASSAKIIKIVNFVVDFYRWLYMENSALLNNKENRFKNSIILVIAALEVVLVIALCAECSKITLKSAAGIVFMFTF